MTAVGQEQNVRELLAQARDLTEPALREAVNRLPQPTRSVAEFHFGWRAHKRHPATGDWGKGIRPGLVLAAARAMGAAPERAASAAAGVELVHNFTLIHDDLMDRDALRRGRPTVWALFGDPQAVLTGDALLVVAMQTLAGEPALLSELCATLLCLVAGQGADLAFERRTDVSLQECLTMAAGKTAALLSSACALGGLVAGAEPWRTDALRRFGHHLGLAFQLVDDLLGIWGRSAVSGKPVGADLRRRKNSLPVVAAFAAGGPDARRLAELYRRENGALGDPDIQEAARLIERAGGRAWAQEEAERQRTAALAALTDAAPDPTGAHHLTQLAHAITSRGR
ncbi:polyprenyl synthetase family protein [Streptomyces sp. NPDC087294]|uniref:polyprenyl synthetase family protein n=1 Tax=Streptomyces sp. NPDC087294 TaxID=3365777 RepID=UPI0038266205